ncbi:MAG: TetR/AcrR family transcriptional regulator [Syntrophobacter sp.]
MKRADHQLETDFEQLPGRNSQRDRIIAAARKHFFTRGLRGVTMDELAEELGMSKKTLYVHFPGKAALVKGMLLQKFREVETDLEVIEQNKTLGFHEVLHELMATLHRHTAEVQPPFIHDIQRESPEIFQFIESRRRVTFRRHFGRLLAWGRRSGVVRKDIPLKLIMEIFLGAMQSVANPPKLIELGITPKACISAIITVILEGVVTGEGRSKP